jgi:hypothetical protein
VRPSIPCTTHPPNSDISLAPVVDAVLAMGRADTPTKDRGKPYQRSPRDGTPQRESVSSFQESTDDVTMLIVLHASAGSPQIFVQQDVVPFQKE